MPCEKDSGSVLEGGRCTTSDVIEEGRRHNALDGDLRKQVVEAAWLTYAGCNTHHFTELLAQREGINLSRSSVRRVLLKDGIRTPRTVATDNGVRFGERRLQILPSNGRFSYARASVEVHERMNGSLAVYYEGHCLATKPAPPEPPVLRV